ncbi:TolC family protein [Nannocystis sp. SCPEA4]|uniref:TolC family protein n=1 Tax=Nannocystis sp. SCPEA4 TaxID=2996787 RepID=UPI002270A713|nr:TolC family protein [Nannocystis sp. SCPEA4]MCY1057343.1 TolC family protein [Nannocystis sp. SCPEA4]
MTRAWMILSSWTMMAVGCVQGPAISPERAVATWHEMQVGHPRGALPESAVAALEAGDALTVEQVYALALANNPELAVVEARAEVATEEIAAARQIANPSVRVSNVGVDDSAQGRLGFNLGLRAPIPRPGSVRARVDGARHAAAGAQGQAEAARRQLRVRVYRLFARLAWLTADLEEVTRAVSLCDERQRQLRARVARAVATDVELALADVARAEAVDEARKLRGELARTEAELARVVGPGPAFSVRVDRKQLDIDDLMLDPTALTEHALRARPELRMAQTKVGQARSAVTLAKVEAAPWVSWAQVNYFVGPGTTTPASFGLALAIDVPLFSLNRGKIRAAKALARQRQVEERAEVAAIAGEVGEAIARAQRADARVHEIEQGLLPQVDAAARQADAALAAGTLDVVEVLDIEARRVAARRLHLAARFERRDALIELEAAVGAPLPR